MSVIYGFSQIPRVFVPYRLGQPSLMVRPGAYPRMEHLKGALLGQTPALPTNIRLGWKYLPATNTLAYHVNP